MLYSKRPLSPDLVLFELFQKLTQLAGAVCFINCLMLSINVELDQNHQIALRDLLHERNLSNLVLTPANFASLEELVNILAAFAEVTDVIQGDQYPTLGCVVPSLVSLHKILVTQCEKAQ